MSNQQCTIDVFSRLSISNQEVRRWLANCRPERVLSVAVDFHKNVNLFLAINGRWRVIEATTALPAIASGWETFASHLRRWLNGEAYDLVMLTHEPTGVYHEPWMYALLDQFTPYLASTSQPRLLYRWQHTEAVKLERRQQYHRQRKTDQIDLWCMNTLNLRGEGQTPLVRHAPDLALSLAVNRLRTQKRQQHRLGRHIQHRLDRLWPGALGNAHRFGRAWPRLPPLHLLVKTRPLERERVRILLQHCPDPYQILDLGIAGIQQLYRSHGLRCGEKTAGVVYEAFAQAVLPPPALAGPLAAQVQQDFAAYRAMETPIRRLEEEEIPALLPASQAGVLVSAPGVSPVLAARYLAAIVDWRRFPSPGHIWSYLGLDPIVDSSGNRKRTYCLSKKGSPFGRDALLRIGYQMALHCPPVSRAFLRAVERGMSDVAATIHAAHKANRILFALLRDQKPYTSPFSPAQAARWQERMAAYLDEKRRGGK